ncbi:MAG: hypothetical protein ACRELB_27530 [Polyangiaceae bacterium]
MATTISGKDAASTETGHVALGPPVPSNIPPMAPPTPTGVPAPFQYVAKSSSATKTASKVFISGGEAVVEGSEMDVEPPGNQPSQPAPLHDLVTMVVCKKFVVT